MDGVQLRPLTVDFHEPGFAAQIGGENGQPFWFQMSNKQRQKAGDPWGPQNPQALNRYSYVWNNPIKYTDPSGHSVYLTHEQAEDYAIKLHEYATYIRSKAASLTGPAAIESLIGLIPGMGIIGGAGTLIGAIAIFEYGIHANSIFDFNGWADNVDKYADFIQEANKDSKSGVIISVADQGDAWGDYCGGGCNVTIISRDTGNGNMFVMPGLPGRFLFSGGPRVRGLGGGKGSIWVSGHACTYSGQNPSPGNYYKGDHALCR